MEETVRHGRTATGISSWVLSSLSQNAYISRERPSAVVREKTPGCAFSWKYLNVRDQPVARPSLEAMCGLAQSRRLYRNKCDTSA